MIKINLLPPGIHRAKQIKAAIAVVTVLVAAEVGGWLWYRTIPSAERDKRVAEKADVDGQLAKLQPLGTESATVLAAEAALAPKFDFFTKLPEYNRAYPNIYRRTAGYTYAEVTFLNLEASTNELKFDAYVTQPRDVGYLLMGLSRNPDFNGLPSISGVPNYSEADEAVRKAREKAEAGGSAPSLVVNGMLGGSVGAEGGSAAPGMGAPGGGANGPGGAMPGAMGGPSSAMLGRGGGGGNGPSGGGGMMPSAAGVSTSGTSAGGGASRGGGNGPGGAPGAAGGGGGGGLDALRLAGAAHSPRGFTVTVSASLKNPVSRPSYGSSESQLGSSGGGGGMGPGGGGGMSMRMSGGGGGGNGPK